MYLVECKPDATLVKSLTGTSRKNIIHAGNKTELLKGLTKHFTNSIGIVDEDPWSHQSPLLNKFKKVQNLTKCDIKIFCRKSGNNLLIMLCPRLEEWILKAAHEANVNPKDYGLPDDAEKLREQINIKTDKFQQLVEAIKLKSERLKKLRWYLLHGYEDREEIIWT